MEKQLAQRAADCIRVVLFGPESTGKTTLSIALAEHYKTLWVPEFAREYLQEKWDSEKKICDPEDLLPIAIGQMKMENELAQKTKSVLICDTDLLETMVYSEAYYNNTCNQYIKEAALKNTYEMYFLTYIDTPWVADDLRDKPTERAHMFKLFENALIENNRPYTILKGTIDDRMQIAKEVIDKLLEKA